MNSADIMSVIAEVKLIADTQAMLVSRAGASTQHTELVLREIVERLGKLEAPTHKYDYTTILEDAEALSRDLAEVVGAVEATREEEFGVWTRFVDRRDPPLTWKQHGGYLRTIGYLDGLPVCVSLTFNTVAGHRILFYHATSRVVDHEMVREFIDAILPDEAKARRTDATNFVHCLPSGWAEATA